MSAPAWQTIRAMMMRLVEVKLLRTPNIKTSVPHTINPLRDRSEELLPARGASSVSSLRSEALHQIYI